MPVSSLPPAPSRADPPATFVAKADAFVAALQQLVTEMNAVVGVANITKWISGTTYAIGDVTWSPLDFQAYRRKTAGAGTTDPSLDTTNWQRTEVSGSSLQAQSFTAFTSAGTAPAFTLTPSPAIAAYAANQRFRAKFHAAGTTGSNTLNVSGLGVKSIKQYDATGTKVAGVVVASQLADLEYDGTDFVILNPPTLTVTTTSDAAYADSSIKPASTGWVRGAMSAIATAAGFAASLAATGYIKFPSWLGGAIFQWGVSNIPNGSNTITYPIAFPNAAYVALATSGGNNAGSNTTSYTTSIGVTTFTLVSAVGVTTDWKWIAIGR